METLWFCLVAFMIAMYFVLDGFDLGAGVLHLFAARTEEERRIVLRTVGPVWDGNEVWLLAGGGVLYLAFPTLYAAGFSGFYLPLMVVLWLLILRAIAIEFRNHVNSRAWIPFWDVIFACASTLLIIFFGAALGNVVRGVPLDESARFFEPLWTSFLPEGNTGILDWYTVLTGLTALFTLTVHGAAWIALKTEGDLQARARNLGKGAWWGMLLLAVAVSFFSFRVQPHIPDRVMAEPWIFLFPALALIGLFGIRVAHGKANDRSAFLFSCLFIISMLLTAVLSLYPMVLPAVTDPANSLTVENAATSSYALTTALKWWIPGMVLVGFYFFYTYRKFAGKVRLEEEGY